MATRSFWNFRRTQHAELADDEIRELTAQFYVTLEAYFAKVKCAGSPRCQDAYQGVEQLLANGPRNWTNAYAVEQLLVHLFDDATLASELRVRAQEAKGTLSPSLADYYAAEAANTTQSADTRRALLSRLVNDLQWRYTVNEVKRGYTKEITLATGQLFIFSMLGFAFAVLLAFCFPDLQQRNLHLVVPAILAGSWGAAFSMLSSLRDRLDASELDALKVLRGRWVLGSRMLIGAGAASVLYFFFVSGLVTGPAFPELKSGVSTQQWPETFGLLVVWCFVAGFSERLIPGLLARTEGRLDTASGPERFRPANPNIDAPNVSPPPPANPQARPPNPAAFAKGQPES